jgi:hypothetical protein
MEGDAKGKTYTMKGHTLPGINQRSEGNTDLPDGRSKSSAFQFGNIMSAMGVTQGMGRNIPQNNPMIPQPGIQPVPSQSMNPPIRSKPSMAKIYNKSKLTKEVLK